MKKILTVFALVIGVPLMMLCTMAPTSGGGGGGTVYTADEATITQTGNSFGVKNSGIGSNQVANTSLPQSKLDTDAQAKLNASHTQNTDTGTTSKSFRVNSDATGAETSEVTFSDTPLSTGFVFDPSGSGGIAYRSKNGSKYNFDDYLHLAGYDPFTYNTTFTIGFGDSDASETTPLYFTSKAGGSPGVRYSPGSTKMEVSHDGTSWVTIATGGVSGSGTAGMIPKFTASGTIGDSLLSETMLKTHHLVINLDPSSTTETTLKTDGVCIIPATSAAITVTGITVTNNTSAQEVAGDLKWADTFIGKGNATVINDFDTTSGVRSDTSISSGNVASGKALYLLFDSVPNAAITQAVVDISFTYD